MAVAGLSMASPERDSLTVRLDAAFHRPLKESRWSCSVVRVSDGEVLYERNPTRCQPPASNQKLVVAAAALKALGPAYRAATEVLADGALENGTVAGNLIFRGRGSIHFTGRYQEGVAAMNLELERRVAAFAALLRRCGVVPSPCNAIR